MNMPTQMTSLLSLKFGNWFYNKIFSEIVFNPDYPDRYEIFILPSSLKKHTNQPVKSVMKQLSKDLSEIGFYIDDIISNTEHYLVIVKELRDV